MDDDFRDLAPLRPSADPDRWARMVAAVEAAAASELARRAAVPYPEFLTILSNWHRPALSAAALAAGLAGMLLFQSQSPAPAEEPGVAESLGYPGAVSEWIQGGVVPSVEELLIAVEGS